MTVTLPPGVDEERTATWPAAPPAEPALPATEPPAPPTVADPDEVPPLGLGRVLLATTLSTTAAAWLVGGIFDGPGARLLGVLAAVLGTGAATATFRTARGGLLRVLLLPALLLLAVLAAYPGAAGSVQPVEAVRTAVSSGGLLQPPVAFEPGWHVIVVALVALLGAGTAILTATARSPRLAVMLPLPVVVAAALVAPSTAGIVSAGVGLVLVVGALMVLYGVEVAGGGGGIAFELRRSARGIGALLLAVVALVILNQTNVLFPGGADTRTIPPQKPTVIPLDQVKDRVLFTVTAPAGSQGPWRLGTLDVYDGSDFLLPPYDVTRFVPAGNPIGTVHGAPRTFTFRIADIGSRTLPDVAGVASVSTTTRLQYDPRTQTVVSPTDPQSGLTYVVTASAAPTGDEMRARPAVQTGFETELQVPTPPAAVRTLLAKAPSNPYERVQFLRQALFDTVVGAGAGVPTSVSPQRVADMLAGAHASPYEIAAAQVLLARWAGVPARLGFGFYGGDAQPDGSLSMRPKDGANWPEMYFDGIGWVPLIGAPTHAVSTLTSDPRNHTQQTHPSQQLSLTLYVPVRTIDPLLLYQIVRFWLLVVAPFVLVALLSVALLPVPVRLIRSQRRRAWARAHGPAGAIAVAYAEMRDATIDLRAGSPWSTPLEYVDEVAPDAEHEELAWLVTRALWGDLRRDLQPHDVAAAEELSRSVRHRIAIAQSPTARVLALTSRASLRAPYDPGMPTGWFARREPQRTSTTLLPPPRRRTRLRGVLAVPRLRRRPS